MVIINQVKKILFFGLLSICSLQAQKPEINYAYLENLILDSEDHILQKQENTIVEEKTFLELAHESMKELAPEQKKQLAFTILDKNSNFKNNSSIFEPYILYDLSILKGSELSKKINLYSTINKTQTVMGSAHLARKLATPLTDRQTLKQRQQFIKFLVKNEKIFNDLDVALKAVAASETYILSFWNKGNSLNILSNLVRIFDKKESLAFLNSSPRAQQILRNIALAGLGIGSLYSSLLIIACPIILGQHSGVKGALGGSLISLAVGWLSKLLYDGVTLNHSIVYSMHKSVTGIKNLIRACSQVHVLLANHKELTQALELYEHIIYLVEKSELLDKRLKKLIELINKDTFSKAPSWRSHFGNIIAAYSITEEIKDILVASYEALGELDTYSAIAKLLKSYAGKENTYSFVEFIDRDTPYIELNKVWNPLIQGDLVINEDILLGQPEAAHNMILTGPHGGGKSTIMKSILYSILLAQAFGIAPTTSAKLTIFDKINTYVNIKEDLAQGQSTFMAEKKRVDKIQRVVERLKPGQKCFTIMDEVFKGTMEAEGSRRLHKFGTAIGAIPGNICIIATHFEKPAALEKETGEFTNYHVGLIEQPDGSFVRTFKLIKGANEWWFNNPDKRERYIDWLTSLK